MAEQLALTFLLPLLLGFHVNVKKTPTHIRNLALKVNRIDSPLLLRLLVQKYCAEAWPTNVRVSQAFGPNWILLDKMKGCLLECL